MTDSARHWTLSFGKGCKCPTTSSPFFHMSVHFLAPKHEIISHQAHQRPFSRLYHVFTLKLSTSFPTTDLKLTTEIVKFGSPSFTFGAMVVAFWTLLLAKPLELIDTDLDWMQPRSRSWASGKSKKHRAASRSQPQVGSEAFCSRRRHLMYHVTCGSGISLASQDSSARLRGCTEPSPLPRAVAVVVTNRA